MALVLESYLAESMILDAEGLIEHLFSDEVLPAPAERLYETLQEIIQRHSSDEHPNAPKNIATAMDAVLPRWSEAGDTMLDDEYMDSITAGLAEALNFLRERTLEALQTLHVDTKDLPVRTWSAIRFATMDHASDSDEDDADRPCPLPDLVLRVGDASTSDDHEWSSILSCAHVTPSARDVAHRRPTSAISFLSEGSFDDGTIEVEPVVDKPEDDLEEGDLEDDYSEEDDSAEYGPPDPEPDDGIPSALERAIDAGNPMFSNQPGRRNIPGLTLCANALRLVVLDHGGIVASAPIYHTMQPLLFLRVLTGLLFCTPAQLGLDTTLSTKIDEREYTTVGGQEYEVLDTVFASDRIRGAGTVCRRVRREGAELVMKDTWVIEGSVDSEMEILRELDGSVEGIPRLVAHETVCVDGQLDSTANMRKHLTAGDGDLQCETRLHQRYVMSPFAEKLECFESKEELLGAFVDALTAHENLVERNILHQDVWISNIMLYRPTPDAHLGSRKPRRRGLLIDLEKASRLSANGESLQTGIRTGTVPAMSIRVLADDSASATHRPADDLESFFYTFLAICVTFTGPGSAEIVLADTAVGAWDTALGVWDDGREYAELAKTKAAQVYSSSAFERVLDDFTPYFRDMKPCARRLRDAIFGHDLTFVADGATAADGESTMMSGEATTKDEKVHLVMPETPNVTHDAIRRIFEEAIEDQRRRASPRFSSPRLSGSKRTSPFASPERTFANMLVDPDDSLSPPKSLFGARTPSGSPKRPFASLSPLASPTKSPFGGPAQDPFFGPAQSDKRKLDEGWLETPEKRPRVSEGSPCTLLFKASPPDLGRQRRGSST
ncbi:hypothetical protein BD626DRAFT_630167 [Schizophyllum amplum]|uniref:Fungal-type protein kinase domain-containing protein n=1 Tax=Schizophyllum amplum TaxID=97359 RepID=A0A550CG70_9AGAR|nr:hypothetical protein BD626DRAFT_630167 [Auriculariopsis ampla]